MDRQLDVFNIQRFSIYDGPGIRTTVFLKGCTLHCAWCHNPESIARGHQIQFFQDKCIGCGTCRSVCPAGDLPAVTTAYPNLSDRCFSCLRCAKDCPAGAIEPVDRLYGAEELFEILCRDEPFYKESGGGVTFSGGEPLLQSGALSPLLRTLTKKGIHCAVETAGNVPYAAFETALPGTQLFLFDIKAIDPKLHRRGTGADNRRILKNFHRLYAACAGTGTGILVRMPLIPGFNDGEENLENTARLLGNFPLIRGLELMPFHNIAQHKYETLRLPYSYAGQPEYGRERAQGIADFFTQRGVPATVS
jgi:pyruvate formate lyase activating enzyme